jgi:hypothetical protein
MSGLNIFSFLVIVHIMVIWLKALVCSIELRFSSIIIAFIKMKLKHFLLFFLGKQEMVRSMGKC